MLLINTVVSKKSQLCHFGTLYDCRCGIQSFLFDCLLFINVQPMTLKKTDSETPGKKRTSSRHWQSPPVVVIFKDMESFTTKVLQEFVLISR